MIGSQRFRAGLSYVAPTALCGLRPKRHVPLKRPGHKNRAFPVEYTWTRATALDEGNMVVCVGWRYATNSGDKAKSAAMEGRRYISNCKNEGEDAALKGRRYNYTSNDGECGMALIAGRKLVAAFWLVLICFPVMAGGTAPAAGEKVDRIVIEKAARTMTLMSGGKALKTYKVALGGEPKGAKDREGDHKTPEGIYSVAAKIAHSKFHLGLLISYPNATDRERARKLGVRPGGAVEIHGLGEKYGWVGAAHRSMDWTDGCIAVTNEEIDEIYPMVEVGTVVEIRP